MSKVRLVRMFGMAAIAALAAMAFVTVTSASADSLCLEPGLHKGECKKVWTGDVLGLTNSAVLLNLSNEPIETCHSEVLGLGKTIKNQGSHIGLEILIDPLIFDHCEGICTEAKGSVGAWLLIEALPLDAWVTKDGTLKAGATLKGCFLGVECTYELTNEPQLLGVTEDLLVATEVPLARTAGSSLCPATGRWDAKYLVTEDKPNGAPIYVAALP